MAPIAPGSPRALREANAARIVEAVRAAGSLTHAEIARRTELSPASVTNIVRDLAGRGIVTAEDAILDGRRCRIVQVKAGQGIVLGIDIGRTHLRACLASRDRRVLAETTRPLPAGALAEVGIGLAREMLDELLATGGITPTDVIIAGVGVPGPIDHATGMIGAGTLLPQWTGIDLPKRFSEALGLPTLVENDANLGALGEFTWEPDAAATTVAYIRLATGIGGGLVIDGKLYGGAGGTAGEIGHVTVDENGPLCRCGNRGCLETMANVPAQLALLAASLDRPIDVPTWVELAQAGQPAAARLMDDMGRRVGTAVANLCNLINPEVVALGGPVTQAGDLLLTPLRAEVRRRAIPAASDLVTIRVARHGVRSEVYGALCLALAAADDGAGLPT